MPSCPSINPLVTPYVDGELEPTERQAIDQHLQACPRCRGRVTVEQGVRALLKARQSLLQTTAAPPALRSRCAGFGRVAPVLAEGARGNAGTSQVGPTSRWDAWRGRFAPLAAAALLVVIVGSSFLYQATARSSHLMAAELAADHMKCFAMNAALGTHQSAETVQSSMASGFGWPVRLPVDGAREGLDLVGSRPCLYGEGKVAHIMYRHNGTPVSLFMLPRSDRPEELVEALGHECAIWSTGNRTFVLVARDTREDVEHLAAFVRAQLQ